MGFFILVYYIVAASAQFTEYDGISPNIGGTMQVTITENFLSSRYDQNCNMVGRKNYPDSNFTLHPRYYVKKLELIGAAPQRFQFVATRIPIQDAPGPLPPGTISNPFRSQLGVIYCGRSVLTGLLGAVSGRARAHDNCGIEEILVSFCLNDQDVNVRPEHRLVQDWDQRHTYLDVQQIFARDTVYILPIVEEQCKRVAAFRLQTRAGRSPGVLAGSPKAIRFLRGALLKGYDYVVAAFRCKHGRFWEYYEISYLLTGINTIDDSNDVFSTVYDNFLDSGGDTWYLCAARDRIRRDQINPHNAPIPGNLGGNNECPSNRGINPCNNPAQTNEEANPGPSNAGANPGNN